MGSLWRSCGARTAGERDERYRCRSSGRLRLVYGLDAIKNLAEVTHRNLNVVVVLQVEPKLRSGAECLGEAKRGIGSNAGLFAGDPLDPCARQAAGFGKSACRHSQ